MYPEFLGVVEFKSNKEFEIAADIERRFCYHAGEFSCTQQEFSMLMTKYKWFFMDGLNIANDEDRTRFISEYKEAIEVCDSRLFCLESIMPYAIIQYMERNPAASFVKAVREIASEYRNAYTYPLVRKIISVNEEGIKELKISLKEEAEQSKREIVNALQSIILKVKPTHSTGVDLH